MQRSWSWRKTLGRFILPGALAVASSAAPPAGPPGEPAREGRPPDRRHWSVGASVIAKTQPYRGADWRVIPLPIVTYDGPRVRWFGPMASVLLLKGEAADAALTAAYRFDGYESNDDPVFKGLPEPRDTVEAGLRLGWRPAERWRTDLTASQDVLDRHGGQRVDLALRYTVPAGPTRWIPELGLEWLSPAFTGYYYGVEDRYGTETRPAYDPGSAWEPYTGVSALHRMGGPWFLAARLNARLLSREVTDSPLVDDKMEFLSMLSITRAL